MFIHKNCYRMFLSTHFLFWEILNTRESAFAMNVTLNLSINS